MTGNVIFFALAAAGRGGIRFAVIWAFVAFWSLVLVTGGVAIVINAMDIPAGPNNEMAVFFIYIAWAVLYLNALGIAMFSKLR
jgi:hypothetical protein